MSNHKNTKILFILLSVISTAISGGTFQEEVFDSVSAMYNYGATDLTSQFFKMSYFKEYRMHSKFLVFEPMNADEWEDENATELRNLVTQGGNTKSLVNILHRQFFNPNLFQRLQEENLYSTPVNTLTNQSSKTLSQKVLVMPEVEMNLEAWINQNQGALRGIQFLSIYLQMILLVQEFNFTGYNYCNTRLDGFAINKHGELKLYDYSGVSGIKNCKARSGLNPVVYLKNSKKPHDHDSFGLGQAFDQMFFERVKANRNNLDTYKNSKVAQLLNGLFENTLSEEYSFLNNGHKSIEEFYDDIYNFHIYKKSQNEAKVIREQVCPGGDEAWNNYVSTNQESINKCNNYENTFEWCKDSFLVNNCSEIIKSHQLWKQIDFPLQHEQLCEIREELDTVCQTEGIEENLSAVLSENEVWLDFCSRTEHQYCTGIQNEDMHDLICPVNSSICTYSQFYQWTFEAEFTQWCEQEDKCSETNEVIQWCDNNMLLVLWSNNPKQFKKFCEYEANYKVIITNKVAVVQTYHLMVREYFRKLLEQEFNNQLINNTAMQPRTPLLDRLAGPIPKSKKSTKNAYMGVITDQVFKLETRFTALFGIHFMYSFFTERKDALKATSNNNDPNFFRIAKLGKYYKHCDLELLFSTIQSAFSKGAGAIDNEEEFRQLINFFGSHANNKPASISSVNFVNNLEKCRDNVLGYLFMRNLRFPIQNIPTRNQRFSAMMDYLKYGTDYLQLIQMRII